MADSDAVRAMYAAFGELAEGRDIETYVATFWDPECEYYPVEETEPIRGREQMIGWHHRWFEAWDALVAHVAQLTELNGTIVTRVEVEARGGASGTPIAQTFFHVIELHAGRIRVMREFLEEAEARAAAGR